jgi:hypothetical protein
MKLQLSEVSQITPPCLMIRAVPVYSQASSMNNLDVSLRLLLNTVAQQSGPSNQRMAAADASMSFHLEGGCRIFSIRAPEGENFAAVQRALSPLAFQRLKYQRQFL